MSDPTAPSPLTDHERLLNKVRRMASKSRSATKASARERAKRLGALEAACDRAAELVKKAARRYDLEEALAAEGRLDAARQRLAEVHREEDDARWEASTEGHCHHIQSSSADRKKTRRGKYAGHATKTRRAVARLLPQLDANITCTHHVRRHPLERVGVLLAMMSVCLQLHMFV